MDELRSCGVADGRFGLCQLTALYKLHYILIPWWISGRIVTEASKECIYFLLGDLGWPPRMPVSNYSAIFSLTWFSHLFYPSQPEDSVWSDPLESLWDYQQKHGGRISGLNMYLGASRLCHQTTPNHALNAAWSTKASANSYQLQLWWDCRLFKQVRLSKEAQYMVKGPKPKCGTSPSKLSRNMWRKAGSDPWAADHARHDFQIRRCIPIESVILESCNHSKHLQIFPHKAWYMLEHIGITRHLLWCGMPVLKRQ